MWTSGGETSKKRPAFEEIGGAQKRPMTHPGPNPQEKDYTQIAYHSSVDEKENPLPICIDKMTKDAQSLRHNATQQVVGNEGGFAFLDEVRELRAELRQLDRHRQVHFDYRERTISAWVRDAYKKDIQPREDRQARQVQVRNLNKLVHGGEIKSDIDMVNDRFPRTSLEWQKFNVLYGLNPDQMNKLDQKKCGSSLWALDRVASIILAGNLKDLCGDKEKWRKPRDDLVAMLVEERYEDAEKLSVSICPEDSD